MYRYILEPYQSMKNKHKCPNCHKKTFTRYIDTETLEYINENVGRCDREIKCGYHYKPKEYFEHYKQNYPKRKFHKTKSSNYINKIEQTKRIDYISDKLVESSLNHSFESNFISFLKDLFGYETTLYLIKKYRIGTSNYWKGANIFWQIDVQGQIRTGKIMLYDKNTGKRIKKPFNHINWVHKTLSTKTKFNLKQCLFGEHLLKNDNEKIIAIVESEKTAIISSVLVPEMIWLATGGLNNLSYEKTQILNGRKVILFPDSNALKKWKQKSKTLSSLIDLKIYDFLEKNSSKQEKEKGYDIADYFINEIKKIEALEKNL